VLTLDVLPPQVVEQKPALRPLKEVLLEAERRAFRQAVAMAAWIHSSSRFAAGGPGLCKEAVEGVVFQCGQ